MIRGIATTVLRGVYSIVGATDRNLLFVLGGFKPPTLGNMLNRSRPDFDRGTQCYIPATTPATSTCRICEIFLRCPTRRPNSSQIRFLILSDMTSAPSYDNFRLPLLCPTSNSLMR